MIEMMELTPLAELGIVGIAMAALFFSFKLSNGAMTTMTDVVKNNTMALGELQLLIGQNHNDLVSIMKKKR